MDAIKMGGNVEVILAGRELTVYDYDNGQERDYAWSVVLTPEQCGAILDEIASTQEVIVPGDMLGDWLQQAFNSGLGVGRAEAEQAS